MSDHLNEELVPKTPMQIEEFEELTTDQMQEIVHQYDEKVAYTQSVRRAEEYRSKKRNLFADGYHATHGGSDYIKMPFLRRHGIGKKKESDDNYIRNIEKAKSRQGLLDGSEEGIFDNMSDRKQMEYVEGLALRCKEYYDIQYATPDFMETIAVVDTYLTASTYEAQQAAAHKVIQTLEQYLVRHGNAGSRDAAGDDLYDKILRLHASFLSRMNGSLIIPEDVPQKDIIQAKNPNAGGGITVKYNDVFDKVLFPHEPSPNDVKQRITSDCYLMSALASIAYQSPERIKSAMKDNGKTVTVRFYDPNDGYAAKYVTVEKSIPMVTGTSIHVHAVDCLWVQMIEKAFAAFYGNAAIQDNHRGATLDDQKRSYAELNYKDSFQFLSRFLGVDYAGEPQSLLPSQRMYDEMKEYEAPEYRQMRMVNAIDSGIYSPVAQRLYTSFAHRLRASEIITVGVTNEDQTPKGKQIIARGIHLNHAYAVLKVFEKQEEGARKLFVRVRDPYGAYTSGYDAQNQAIRTGNRTLMLDATSTMGTFDLEWNDFLDTFNSYSGCKSEYIPELASEGYQMAKAKEKLEVSLKPVAKRAQIRAMVLGNHPELEDASRKEELDQMIDQIIEEEAKANAAAALDDFLNDADDDF